MITTLCFFLYPIRMFLKTLATTSLTLLIYYVLHVASPRINDAKYFIISHVACKYACLKTQQLSFIALLLMPPLSEHERSGAIGMLKADMRVSGVASYHNCHLSEIVTRLLVQLKIDAGLGSQIWRLALRAKLRRLCIDGINIDDIRSSWVQSLPDE